MEPGEERLGTRFDGGVPQRFAWPLGPSEVVAVELASGRHVWLTWRIELERTLGGNLCVAGDRVTRNPIRVRLSLDSQRQVGTFGLQPSA